MAWDLGRSYSTSLEEATRTVQDISDSLHQGRLLIVAIETFGSAVVTAADKVLHVHAEIQNEEIRRIDQVKAALHNLVMVAEKAFVFLNKVDDVFWYCKGNAMTAASEDLNRTVGDSVLSARSLSSPMHETQILERRGIRLVKGR